MVVMSLAEGKRKYTTILCAGVVAFANIFYTYAQQILKINSVLKTFFFVWLCL